MVHDVSVAAVDLGASSGRVVLGRVGSGTLRLETVARFSNGPTRIPGVDGLRWDVDRLFAAAVDGIRAARGHGPLASLGIDTWAVDYGLEAGGRLLAAPYSYRDERHRRGAARVLAAIGADELYRRTGLQHLDFNTVFQLAADPDLARAERVLLVPDLLAWQLTGRAICERTNASTTGLLDVLTGDWDAGLLDLVGLRSDQLGELTDPGETVGEFEGTPVVTVGSHDTASAVVAVPMSDRDAAYISCGTWGLVGVELERPVVTEAARAANFTNEGGVDGRIRFLTNVMGTWLLSETLRAWGLDGADDLARLLDQAAAHGGPTAIVDVQDARFVVPNEAGATDMPTRLLDWAREHDVAVPQGKVALVRTIVASLAVAFGDAVEQAARLSGVHVRRVHVVGGGAQNTLLCQLLADRLELPVLAGPVEATALGNVLVQGRAAGAVTGSLESLRALVSDTQTVRELRPRAKMVR